MTLPVLGTERGAARGAALGAALLGCRAVGGQVRLDAVAEGVVRAVLGAERGSAGLGPLGPALVDRGVTGGMGLVAVMVAVVGAVMSVGGHGNCRHGENGDGRHGEDELAHAKKISWSVDVSGLGARRHR